jgi:hypothetical protein
MKTMEVTKEKMYTRGAYSFVPGSAVMVTRNGMEVPADPEELVAYESEDFPRCECNLCQARGLYTGA